MHFILVEPARSQLGHPKSWHLQGKYIQEGVGTCSGEARKPSPLGWLPILLQGMGQFDDGGQGHRNIRKRKCFGGQNVRGAQCTLDGVMPLPCPSLAMLPGTWQLYSRQIALRRWLSWLQQKRSDLQENSHPGPYCGLFRHVYMIAVSWIRRLPRRWHQMLYWAIWIHQRSN